MSKRERTILRQTYVKGTLLRQDVLPKCPHVLKPFKVIECHLLAAGIVERAGERLEFQEIRIYLREQ